MNPHFTVNVGDGCQISSRVTCGAQVTFLCGDGHAGAITLTFNPDALRELMRQGALALDEVEARFLTIRAEAV